MEQKQLLVATSNKGKFKEICEILGHLPYKILALPDLGLTGDYEEMGETFEENALGKAKYYAEKSGIMTIAEDSGILVEALKGELGVKTRRWGKGENANDEEWIEHFLEIMKQFPNEKQRKASFVCCSALVVGDGESFVFEGRTDGVITPNLEAPIQHGLPLSSCFIPEGFEKVYAALAIDEKNRVSHRGKAMQALSDFLLARKD